MKLRIYALLYFAIAFSPAMGFSQTRSLYSNLANPAIGLNALFSGNVAPDLDEPYGVHFDAAEVSFVSEVDPYWTLWANIAFTAEEVDPEEIWARTTRIPRIRSCGGSRRSDTATVNSGWRI